MNKDKIHVLMLGDHALFTSGVAHQLRLISLALLKSGQFKITQLGAAVKHQDYRPVQPKEFNGDWTIIPVEGFGTKEIVRSMLRTHKIDLVLYMSDPRFYSWFHEIENEVRALVPTVWYTIWDNYPEPMFNKPIWESQDLLVCISKVTHDLVGKVAPNTPRMHLPHVVDTEVFKPLGNAAKAEFRKHHFPEWSDDHFMAIWVNRNARRKLSGTVIAAWKEFLDKNNLHDKATLLMHTNSRDPNGQNLDVIIRDFGLGDGQVVISEQKIGPSDLNVLYNMSDVSINISDAEGFGLGILESKAAGVPVIANLTGGMVEQMSDGETVFGVSIEPSAKALIGSQEVPYIYEDRVSIEDVVDAFTYMWQNPELRAELGDKARDDVMKRFNFDDFNQKWVDILTKVHEEHGSWPNVKFNKYRSIAM